MITQDSTQIIQLTCSQNGVEVEMTGLAHSASAAPGINSQVVISAASTVQISANAPAAGTTNEWGYVSIKNTFAGANAITVQKVGGVTTHSFYGTLQQNERAEYTHAQGWRTLDANGQVKQTMPGYLLLTGGTLSGALTLSAALTYGGVTLSNAVTGTGNMVLSASPTLTGTTNVSNITASGTIQVATGAAVGGATPGTGGVAFPAAAVAVVDANTLDDYEEGTVTLTLSGSTGNPTTPVTVSATYTKIGRLVSITVEFSNKSMVGASGNVQITGLPFAAGVDYLGSAAMFGFTVNTPLSQVLSGTTIISIIEGGSTANVAVTAATGKYVWVSITYSI